MISRDGGWLSVVPSDAVGCCVLHVSCMEGDRASGGREGGREEAEKRFPQPPRRTLDSKADVTSETHVAPCSPCVSCIFIVYVCIYIYI